MVFLVPYDGSPLATVALRRAVEFASEQDVVALTIVPSNVRYAVDKGWVESATAFDTGEVVDRLATEVHEIAPNAEFTAVRTESRPPPAKLAKLIRQEALDRGATVVFLGSENAGKIVTPVSSVAPSVSADERYDVYIARRRVGEE